MICDEINSENLDFNKKSLYLFVENPMLTSLLNDFSAIEDNSSLSPAAEPSSYFQNNEYRPQEVPVENTLVNCFIGCRFCW